MNELKIFETEEFGEIRTVVIENVPWFVGKDVALILGYKDTTSGIRKNVDDEDKRTCPVGTPSGIQNMTIINESGLYSLIFSSKLEAAKKFKHWVTSEVLPALRENGTYSIPTSYQYPIPASALESATNAGRLIERIMRREGSSPHEIAAVVKFVFQQAGVELQDCFIKIPAYEQLVLSGLNY